MPNNDDAELLTLAPQLEQLANAWLAQMAADRSYDAAHDARVEKLTGIPAADAPPYNKDTPYWTIHEAVAYDQPRLHIDETWTAIHARLFPLCENILRRRATTLPGLAVQATAVSLAAAELWDPSPHDNAHERSFIEAVCDFVGVVPVPLRPQTPRP
jgi:hypothetical protein